MQEFIQLLQEVFPSVEPFTAARAKEAIQSFLRGRPYVELANPPFEQYLCQGDIVDEVHFSMIDDEGNLVEGNYSGMLLSHTCDAVRDETVIFAACYPSEDYFQKAKESVEQIRQNRISTLFFIPDAGLIVDFSYCTSMSRPFLEKLLKESRLKRQWSLNRIGHYFYLTKLAYHFMRPDDEDTKSHRSLPARKARRFFDFLCSG